MSIVNCGLVFVSKKNRTGWRSQNEYILLRRYFRSTVQFRFDLWLVSKFSLENQPIVLFQFHNWLNLDLLQLGTNESLYCHRQIHWCAYWKHCQLLTQVSPFRDNVSHIMTGIESLKLKKINFIGIQKCHFRTWTSVSDSHKNIWKILDSTRWGAVNNSLRWVEFRSIFKLVLGAQPLISGFSKTGDGLWVPPR